MAYVVTGSSVAPVKKVAPDSDSACRIYPKLTYRPSILHKTCEIFKKHQKPHFLTPYPTQGSRKKVQCHRLVL